jgi:RNA polymerase sigma-70 factor (ECF subfamily)
LPLDGLDGLDEPVAALTDEPEHFSERCELSDQLAGALLELPPRYRAAVILRHVLGLGYDDIAETLQQPAGTVKSNVHRGIQRLRERLSAPEPARSH